MAGDHPEAIVLDFVHPQPKGHVTGQTRNILGSPGTRKREERLFVGLIVADVHSPWAVWVDCDADLGRTRLAAKINLRLGEWPEPIPSDPEEKIVLPLSQFELWLSRQPLFGTSRQLFKVLGNPKHPAL
jgi:hypothetical protein